MQTRTKIVFFLLGLGVVFVAGICLGKSGLFAGGGILGAIGAAIFGRTIKKGSTRAADVARELSRWLTPFEEVEIVADWPDDIAYFCRALLTGNGQMVTVPPLTFRLMNLAGFSTARNSAVPHNALHDARALRDHVLHRGY